MLVPDASAMLAALTVDTPDGASARSALQAAAGLHAPHLLDLEVLSGLRGLLIGGKIEARRAAQSRTDFWDLPIARYPHRALSERVWELRHNLSVYDAAYVALAEILGATLLTSDAALTRAPGIGCDVQRIPPIVL